jgi:hypothetical protein
LHLSTPSAHTLSPSVYQFGISGGFVKTPWVENGKVVYEAEEDGGRWARWAVVLNWLKCTPAAGSRVKVILMHSLRSVRLACALLVLARNPLTCFSHCRLCSKS